MAMNPPVQVQTPKIKKQREEMWWVVLAKSKTLRFFAVSCEFILFLGGLWITFTVNDPSAKNLLGGNVNMIFLTVMGWAVDAAMPEAWLHVVIQHVKKRTGQLSWSKFVAICISLLFIGNIIYSVFTGGDKSGGVTGTPVDATGWILLILIILRISVGFVYITVRQCQEWIDRKESDETAPATPAVNEQMSKALEKITTDQAQVNRQMLTALDDLKAASALPQIIPPPIDPAVLVEAASEQILRQVEAQFEAINQAILRQNVVIEEATNEAKRLPQNAASNSEMRQKNEAKTSASSSSSEAKHPASKNRTFQANKAEPNILRFVPASATRDEMKAEAIRLHEVMGLSSYEVAEKLGKSAKTVQNWLRKGKDEAETEATGTDE